MAGKIRTLTGSDVLTQEHNYQLTTATNWLRMIGDQGAFRKSIESDLAKVDFLVSEIMIYQQFHSRLLRAAMNVGLKLPIDSFSFKSNDNSRTAVGLTSGRAESGRVFDLLDIGMMTVDQFMADYIEASKVHATHLVMKQALALLCIPFYSGVPKDLCATRAKIIEDRVVSPAGLATYCAISGIGFSLE